MRSQGRQIPSKLWSLMVLCPPKDIKNKILIQAWKYNWCAFLDMNEVVFH